MTDRRGEKIGWIGGWIGAFCWLPVLSVVWFAKDRPGAMLIGLAITALGLALAVALGPWRYPATPYWKLMLPVFAVFLGAAVASIALEGGMVEIGLTWWSLAWLTPMLIPFVVTGSRRWQDGPGPSPAVREDR